MKSKTIELKISLSSKTILVVVIIFIIFLLHTCIDSIDPTSEKDKGATSPVEDTFPDNVPIGTIVHSLLNETEFQSLRGPNWVLMDGRDMTGSDLSSLIGKQKLPNAGGKFLRGINNLKTDGQSDAQGVRDPGDIQLDATKLPNNPFNADTSGNHDHQSVRNFNLGTHNRRYSGGGGDHLGQGGNLRSSYNGGHTHNIVGGDDETRPVNIAVNIFIKINN